MLPNNRPPRDNTHCGRSKKSQKVVVGNHPAPFLLPDERNFVSHFIGSRGLDPDGCQITVLSVERMEFGVKYPSLREIGGGSRRALRVLLKFRNREVLLAVKNGLAQEELRAKIFGTSATAF